MGFQLASGGQQIVPYQAGQWLVMDDEDADFALSNVPTTGAWQLIGYNTGAFAHVVFVRFHLDPVQQAAIAIPAAPLTITPPVGV